ncbi:MAG TPA: hypothetical protein VN549_05380, partial [Negativicutes bacterium]|nr:hypothetical protein [Negativicutes bacterium]
MATISNQGITSKHGRLKNTMHTIINSDLRLYIITGAIGLLLGRAVILEFLNPFGIAFLAAGMLQELNLFVVSTSILLGVLSIGDRWMLVKYIVTAVPVILVYAAVNRTGINKRLLLTVAAALTNLAAGYLIFYVQNYYMYDLMMVIIESLLVAILICIYDRSIPIVKNFRNRRLLSAEEVVAVTVLAAFCFVGTEFRIAGLSVRNISIIFIIMMFSYLGNTGTGAAVGIIMGIVQALSGSILPSAIGVYGLCGMMCGLLKNLGRFGCPLGFIISNALMTFYINGSTEVLIRFYEILAASAIFVLLPQSLMKALSGYRTVVSGEYRKERSYNLRVKENTIERLSELSEVYDTLAATLKDTVKEGSYFSQADAAQIIDKVVGKYCSGCGMTGNCWRRDFYKSYQYFFNLLTAVENGKDPQRNESFRAFRERCLKPAEIAEGLRYYYDIYRNSLGWKKKMDESRLLVSDQLKEVSAVVSNLAYKIDMDVDFDRDMEE